MTAHRPELSSGVLCVFIGSFALGVLFLAEGDGAEALMAGSFGIWGIGAWLALAEKSPLSRRLRPRMLATTSVAAVLVGVSCLLNADLLAESSGRYITDPTEAKILGAAFAVFFGLGGFVSALRIR